MQDQKGGKNCTNTNHHQQRQKLQQNSLQLTYRLQTSVHCFSPPGAPARIHGSRAIAQSRWGNSRWSQSRCWMGSRYKLIGLGGSLRWEDGSGLKTMLKWWQNMRQTCGLICYNGDFACWKWRWNMLTPIEPVKCSYVQWFSARASVTPTTKASAVQQGMGSHRTCKASCETCYITAASWPDWTSTCIPHRHVHILWSMQSLFRNMDKWW